MPPLESGTGRGPLTSTGRVEVRERDAVPVGSNPALEGRPGVGSGRERCPGGDSAPAGDLGTDRAVTSRGSADQTREESGTDQRQTTAIGRAASLGLAAGLEGPNRGSEDRTRRLAAVGTDRGRTAPAGWEEVLGLDRGLGIASRAVVDRPAGSDQGRRRLAESVMKAAGRRSGLVAARTDSRRLARARPGQRSGHTDTGCVRPHYLTSPIDAASRSRRSCSSIFFINGSHSQHRGPPQCGPEHMTHQPRCWPLPGSTVQCFIQWTHCSVSFSTTGRPGSTIRM